MIIPLAFDWDGEAMVPHQPKLADKHYVVGATYRLAPWEDRSQASHNAFFAALADAHANLPEDIAERLATPEHLRKWALIKAGYRDERTIVCASKAEAQRVAAFVRPMDEYAVVLADGATVMVYTAQSQSFRAMGKQRFQESKDAVLRVVAGLVKTTPDALQANARQVA